MSALDRQRQIELGKIFINAIGVDGARFRNGVHFMCFAAIVAFRTRTEGLNFHI